MIWTQVSANLLIAVAYAAIASTLAILVRRIRNIPFAWVYLAFGAFILSCGWTHFFDVITVWHPVYWADAGVRVLTATASVATAVLIVPMVPKAAAFAEDARLSNARGRDLESTHRALEEAHRQLAEREREAQLRARTSEGQLRSLVQTMPQLTWISDAKGRTTFRNDRWQEYSGLRLSDPAHPDWVSIHHPDTMERARARWDEALATEQPYEVELLLRHADGQYRWFLARALPLRDDQEQVIAWTGSCTDVHDQRLLHEEAVRTAHMKDEFLATVSHELRTPLNAILGWSRMLKEDTLSPEKSRKAIESVERNATAQARLVDDLLDLSRIISGKMHIELGSTNPAEAVEAALDALRPAALAKGVVVSSTIEHDVGPVLADPGRLQQIVWNLVGNALKFTPKSGRVHVSVARVEGNVEIRVVDTGIGIKREFLARLFDRFSQEDGSIRRTHGGLGLGLAITKQLVELHGGQIRAESEGQGQGAEFVVRLPVALGDAAHIAERHAPSASAVGSELTRTLQGVRLLLVEDDVDSREVVAAILGDVGLDVTTAENAERALDLLGQSPFDVILSDVGLPGQDGYAFIKAVRANPALANIPAAALTAYAHAHDRKRALDAGFQRHLRKPFDQAELFQVIADLARASLPAPPSA